MRDFFRTFGRAAHKLSLIVSVFVGIMLWCTKLWYTENCLLHWDLKSYRRAISRECIVAIER